MTSSSTPSPFKVAINSTSSQPTHSYEDGQPIDRKLNVAITRARKQLILTGNEQTLRHNQLFAELIDYIKEKGGYYAEKV